jgi:hypothetical protein
MAGSLANADLGRLAKPPWLAAGTIAEGVTSLVTDFNGEAI